MKRQFLKISLMTAMMVWGTSACDQYEKENLMPSNESPVEGALQNEVPEFIPVLVATIQNREHHLQFYGVGPENVLVVEKLKDASVEAVEHSAIKEELSPLDIFLSVTGPDVAVPGIIANTGEGAAFEVSGRSLDKMNTPIEIISDGAWVVATENCTDVGSTNFRNSYCGGTVISNPNDIRFCDEYIRTSLTRSSYYGSDWEEMDDVNTWTNIICGITRLKFYDWSSGQWNLNTQIDFQDGVRYANYFTSKNRERKVERSQLSGTGFRAYTRFY